MDWFELGTDLRERTADKDRAHDDPSFLGSGTSTGEIVDTLHESVLVLDANLRVESANASFYETFGTAPDDTAGQVIYDLGNGQWDIPELHELLENILADQPYVSDYELTLSLEHVGKRALLLNARRLNHADRILLAIEDITDRTRRLEKMNTTVRRQKAECKRLKKEVLAASQEQCWRIGKNLQKEAAQAITGAKMIMDDHIHRLGEMNGDAMNEAEEVRTILGRVDKQLLELVRGITPLKLGTGDQLRRALIHLAGQTEQRCNIRCETRIDKNLSLRSDERSTHVYRIVKEALQNAVLHSNASEVVVVIREEAGEKHLTITDDGTGPEGSIDEMRKKGIGLRLMQYRCHLLDGYFALEEPAGYGLRVVCRFPSKETAHEEST